MLLKELLQGLEIKKISGRQEISIENIVYDSRKVTKNSLFICIKGFKTDGHLYIRDAIEKGASAILVEEEVNLGGATVVEIENTRKSMAIIANRFYGEPSKSLDLIGVTGTNGKTSTTYMIKKILETSGKKTGLVGTISNWIGDVKIETDRTTPESLDLQKLFKRMLQENVDCCVMEVSSHSLALDRVEECQFKVGVFTNLTPEHLDFHATLEDYKNAKKKLFYKTVLCNIINIDDEVGKTIYQELRRSTTPMLTYSIKEKADIIAENIVLSIKTVTFDLITPKYKEKVEINIPGIFTVYNALAAIAVCYSMDIGANHIVEGLRSIKGVAGRLEPIEEFADFAVIVDYAHTPDALENVLKSIKKFAKNKLITVFGCGGDRDQTKRPIMGEISGSYSDLTIITSDNPRTENPMEIIAMVEDGIRKTLGKYDIIENRREAIRLALKYAEKGDIILIAGKGHETYQIINDNVFEFDDRKVAVEVAKEEGLI
ncbi:UDP-N-acetylmuramoyl-L-alanyl-D-glutamate--2,6-diaminopimelate ligase [Natronincola ferrireducens]|uniref:UDP-N-acetylmuramoyl-L-alanyl-D-glutamate--2,6-diaminopimelate ligase n=1 Tax=Natronincola ferrireducens TaxID=393762 RepID=A0A1G9BLL3_9FIRM|nr:UDP-N-acetylmuramoyl-L-alanyl-D-glutamate--2,6-diaminopimelate ligase [Natronincola ferrireducens]SDK40376.1 UDP-N-acetylmuramoylalanyl-D-glutamate--2,6-diaminopimelate ligase [Natronincola ferrireducens]